MSDLVEEIRALKKNPKLQTSQEYVVVWNAAVTLANEAADEISRLLARLQRAEAVVEEGLRYKREVERNSQTGADHPIPPLCTHDHSPPNEYDASEEDLFKALTAWDAGNMT